VGAFDPLAFDFEAFDAEPPVDPPDPVDPTVVVGSGYSFVPPGLSRANYGIGQQKFDGGRDRLIDPFTRDFVRTATGDWVETQDSRTIVLISMSVRLGRSPFDPSHGTSIQDQIENGSLTSPEFLQSESLRVGTDLTQEGVLSDVVVQVRDEDNNRLVDQDGRQVVRMSWRDLITGSPGDLSFTP
jgi:hypothetical protein